MYITEEQSCYNLIAMYITEEQYKRDLILTPARHMEKLNKRVI